MRQIDPKDIKIIFDLPPVAVKGDKIALDTEWFNMKGHLHRPSGKFASLACTFDAQTVYMIFDEAQVQEFMDRLNAGVHIYHNDKFDIFHMRRVARLPQRKLLWDTMLIEQIMYHGYYTAFGLNDLARRRLDIYLPKDDRKSIINNTTGKMTQDDINYAAADVVATWLVYQNQRAEIDENDLNLWKTVELPFLWVILGMSGVRLDVDKWLEVAKKNKDKADEIKAKYPDINLNSPAQVLKELHKDKRYKKLKSTGEEVLKEIRDECPFADDVLIFRSFSKRASTYGEKFVKDFVEADGKVYGDIFQIGAETGRTSCRNPNLQNQPNEDDYRTCYIASEDGKLVIADWSAQEPRFAAFMSEDQGLIDILNDPKKDLYVEIAREALGEVIKKSDDRRKQIKNLILGIFYGMSPYGLAWRLGIDERTAEGMIKKVFDTFPGIERYVKKQKKAGDYVESIYGRKFWLNKYTKQWERNATNDPIQSSSADAMKIGAYRFAVAWAGKDFYDNLPIVLLVHDEIVIDVHESGVETAAKMLETEMVGTASDMHPGIKGSVGVSIGDTWAAKE